MQNGRSIHRLARELISTFIPFHAPTQSRTKDDDEYDTGRRGNLRRSRLPPDTDTGTDTSYSCLRLASISPLRPSRKGGRTRLFPRSEMFSSTANPGPSVASSKRI